MRDQFPRVPSRDSVGSTFFNWQPPASYDDRRFSLITVTAIRGYIKPQPSPTSPSKYSKFSAHHTHAYLIIVNRQSFLFFVRCMKSNKRAREVGVGRAKKAATGATALPPRRTRKQTPWKECICASRSGRGSIVTERCVLQRGQCIDVSTNRIHHNPRKTHISI